MSSFVQSFRREIAFLKGSFWDSALVLWLPLVLSIILAAQLAGGTLRSVPIVVVDQDSSAVSRQLSSALNGSSTLEVVATYETLEDARTDIQSRRAYAAVLIPDESDDQLARGETASVILYYNASFFSVASSVSRAVSSVTRGLNRDLALRQAAIPSVGAGTRASPISVSVRTLFNPFASYELYLLSFLVPAMLQLFFMVSSTASLGRELRDGTIKEWLGPMKNRFTAILGKLAPYYIAFTAWGLAFTLYMSVGRGYPIHGNLSMIVIAYLAMFVACSSMSLLFVGITRSMVQALSFTGVFAGLAAGFADTVFPLESASAFGQIWASSLPFPWFARALFEQWIIGSPTMSSLPEIGVLLVFLGPGLLFGLGPYLKSIEQPETWGRRV